MHIKTQRHQTPHEQFFMGFVLVSKRSMKTTNILRAQNTARVGTAISVRWSIPLMSNHPFSAFKIVVFPLRQASDCLFGNHMALLWWRGTYPNGSLPFYHTSPLFPDLPWEWFGRVLSLVNIHHVISFVFVLISCGFCPQMSLRLSGRTWRAAQLWPLTFLVVPSIRS